MKEWPKCVNGIHYFGFIRRYHVECHVNKVFVDNGRFIKVRGFRDGKLDIGAEGAMHKRYRTHFGWNFAHNGVIYGDSSANLDYAMRRLFGCRNPLELEDEHQIYFTEVGYRTNQNAFIDQWEDEMIHDLRKSLGYEWYHDDKIGHAVALMFREHDKRKLRIDAVEEIHNKGNIVDKHWTLSIQWKMKLDEIAKPGKYPRVIADLGVVASLECAQWAEISKYYIGRDRVIVDNWCFMFCISPEPEMVIAYMLEVWFNPRRYKGILVVFSDDGILGCYDDENVWKCYNTDISTCDASHTPRLFDFLFKLLDAPSRVKSDYLRQMSSIIRIQDNNNKANKRKAFVKPLEPYLQSGSTITTLVNTVAQYVMFYSLVKTGGDFISASRAAGYIVTLDLCTQIEDLQFLKMSPTLGTDLNYHACLNLGVILRASGTCRGDLPGSKNILPTVRAATFQNQLMSGLLSRIEHPVLSRLAPYGIERNEESITVAKKASNAVPGLGQVWIYDYNIYKRYRLTSDEITQLEYLIGLSSEGSCIYHKSISKILEKDYGLTCPLVD